MSTQDTPIFLPQESIPGSTDHHASARVEGLTSPQVMTTSAAAVSGTVCQDLPLGGFLPKSPHDSPDTSISSQILATSAASGVTMRRNLPQPRNGSSSGSSASDELGTLMLLWILVSSVPSVSHHLSNHNLHIKLANSIV
jgi:hypothetical protein